MYIIVDVGCIECGEETEVRGVYESLGEAEKAYNDICAELGIEKWEPRGGRLELRSLLNEKDSTYLGGTGYFTTGQHALELHSFPAQKKED